MMIRTRASDWFLARNTISLRKRLSAAATVPTVTSWPRATSVRAGRKATLFENWSRGTRAARSARAILAGTECSAFNRGPKRTSNAALRTSASTAPPTTTQSVGGRMTPVMTTALASAVPVAATKIAAGSARDRRANNTSTRAGTAARVRSWRIRSSKRLGNVSGSMASCSQKRHASTPAGTEPATVCQRSDSSARRIQLRRTRRRRGPAGATPPRPGRRPPAAGGRCGGRRGRRRRARP